MCFKRVKVLLLSIGIIDPVFADPVLGAIREMEKHKGLHRAVRKIVFSKNRIHGHDALAISVNVKSNKADIYFEIPSNFEIHADRRVCCEKNSSIAWSCFEKNSAKIKCN